VKPLIENLTKTLESRVRLAAMSVLMVNESIDFNSLKELLHVTDGNLATHMATLEREGYVRVQKRFVGKKPQTTYSATNNGKTAFLEHVDALERLIRAGRR
jgi:DNA-binding HxlR family transcriptional regulator